MQVACSLSRDDYCLLLPVALCYCLLLCGYKVACSLSRDDSRVLCGSEDGSLHAWDLVEATPLARIKGHAGPVVALDCHPSKPELLTASHDGTAKLWRLQAS